MFSATTSRVLLLQVAAFFSGAAARCAPACSPEDPLIALLGSDNDAAVPFCSDFLGLAVSTVSATVTPTVLVKRLDRCHQAVMLTTRCCETA